jgi:RND family efflux transporter MFP subunit
MATARAQPPQVAPVVVSPIVQREVATGKTFVGTIVPFKKAIIGTAVDGRVIEILFDEGDRVQAGQPLARLLTDTINLELKAAQAELEYRQQQLAELENGTRPEDIDQAQAKMLAAKARVTYLRARRERAEKLYQARSAVSEENRDEAVSAAIAAEQDYLEAKAAYDLAVAGPRKEQIAQARAQVRIQEALVDKLADQIKKHTIISRFDGYVTTKQSELGQWVTKGDAVVEVVALDTVEVVTYVPETHVPYVSVGKDVRVEVPALPDRVFTGRVALIIPNADARARTFPVKVRVVNTPQDNIPLLKAGMSARVTLPTGPTQNALLVPKDALVLGGPQPMVFVVDTDSSGGTTGKVRPVAVDLGVTSGRLIQVTGPLSVGQKVVVRGNERLRPGQDVVVSGELPPDPDAVSATASPRP